MSSSRQGLLPKLTIPAGLFRRGINLWPPFVGAGIRVTRVSADSREIDVTLKLRLFNRNFFGTHFGGSLFAMTDPFFALMMLRNEVEKTLYIRRRPAAPPQAAGTTRRAPARRSRPRD
jgi:hypothetical protein